MKDLLMTIFPFLVSALLSVVSMLFLTKSKEFERKIQEAENVIEQNRVDISELDKKIAVMSHQQDVFIDKLNSVESTITKKIDDLYREVLAFHKSQVK